MNALEILERELESAESARDYEQAAIAVSQLRGLVEAVREHINHGSFSSKGILFTDIGAATDVQIALSAVLHEGERSI